MYHKGEARQRIDLLCAMLTYVVCIPFIYIAAYQSLSRSGGFLTNQPLSPCHKDPATADTLFTENRTGRCRVFDSRFPG